MTKSYSEKVEAEFVILKIHNLYTHTIHMDITSKLRGKKDLKYMDIDPKKTISLCR